LQRRNQILRAKFWCEDLPYLEEFFGMRSLDFLLSDDYGLALDYDFESKAGVKYK